MMGTTSKGQAFRVKQIIKQYWSGTWENYERLGFNYDSLGQQNERIKEVFTINTSSGTWTNFSKDTFTRDSLARLTETLTQQWNDGQWNNYFRNQNTFDETGNITLKRSENWQNNLWSTQLGEIRTYVYPNNAAWPDSITISFYNPTLADYVLSRKHSISYSQNLPTQVLTQTWNGTDWQPFSKQTSISLSRDKYPDEDLLTWLLAFRTNYILQLASNGTFVNHQKGIRNFQNDQLQFESYQHWTNQNWTDSSKTEYDFYANGLLKETRNYSFTNQNWFQYDGIFTTYTYNANDDINEQINRTWINQEYENQEKLIYIYEVFSGLSEESTPTFKLYPMPCSTHFYLSSANGNLPELNLYNHLGMYVVKLNPSADGAYYLPPLPSGFYFLRSHQLNLKIWVEK